MADLMKTERYEVETRDGSVYARVTKTRCKLCKTETVGGHPMEVCIFALCKKIEYLEAKLDKAGGARVAA